MLQRNDPKRPVLIVGGGPAGSVAALCLRKLGREVHLFERAKFPRYQIGESLLPGTLSILKRLGVYDRIESAGFIRKRAATFVWGEGHKPLSFTFATSKSAPWVFDYGLQVNRAEYDQILLQAAGDAGAVIHEGTEVTEVDPGGEGETVALQWKRGEARGRQVGSYLIDASGQRGLIASKRKLRRSDAYFRNIALWSYFRGGSRFSGDLAGNILTVGFEEGWIWIIPLKDGLTSIGVVTGIESKARLQSLGTEAFYRQCIESSTVAQESIEGAEQVESVRVLREWSYDATQMSLERAFLCGDAACFIDPLFSQGVHLATYSAMLAGSGIDYLLNHPQEGDRVKQWYDRSYRSVYNRYHQFLCAFYADHDRPDSNFWSRRRIVDASDERLKGADWLASLRGSESHSSNGDQIRELQEGASLLAQLWEHTEAKLGDGEHEQELAHRRVRWASGLLKKLKKTHRIRWKGDFHLETSFGVERESFRLQPKNYLRRENGQVLTSFPVGAEHEEIFKSLREEPLHYNVLQLRLSKVQGAGTPLQTVLLLLQEGFLEAVTKSGAVEEIPHILRFVGVGGDDHAS